MTISSLIQNLIIQKKSKFYQEFQQLESDGVTPIPYVGKELKCIIKESHETDTILHTLTEANGGMIRVDEDTGDFAMSIDADETDITADFAVYDVVAITTADPTAERERMVEGQITYTEGNT